MNYLDTRTFTKTRFPILKTYFFWGGGEVGIKNTLYINILRLFSASIRIDMIVDLKEIQIVMRTPIRIVRVCNYRSNESWRPILGKLKLLFSPDNQLSDTGEVTFREKG